MKSVTKIGSVLCKLLFLCDKCLHLSFTSMIHRQSDVLWICLFINFVCIHLVWVCSDVSCSLWGIYKMLRGLLLSNCLYESQLCYVVQRLCYGCVSSRECMGWLLNLFVVVVVEMRTELGRIRDNRAMERAVRGQQHFLQCFFRSKQENQTWFNIPVRVWDLWFGRSRLKSLFQDEFTSDAWTKAVYSSCPGQAYL